MSSRVAWVIVGILSVLSGIFAAADPLEGSLTAEMLAGWGLLIVGVLQVIFAFRDIDWRARLWAILIGVVFVVAGISLLGNPFAGVISLTVLVAITLLIAGVAKVVVSLSLPRGVGFWLMLISAAISVVLALMILWNFPQAAAVILGLLVAIELMSNGVAMIALGATRRDSY